MASVFFANSGLDMTVTTQPTRRLRRSLRVWCCQAERDAGERDGFTSEEKVRLKVLEHEGSVAQFR